MQSMHILGVKVTPATPRQLNTAVEELARAPGRHFVLSANVHAVNLCRRHPWLAEFLERADVVRVDGSGVVLGARLLGRRIPSRVTWMDWGWSLAEHLAGTGQTLFLLGGPAGAAEGTAQAFTGHAPGLRILGSHHGHFVKQGPENDGVIEKINRLAPDILVVGMGMPLQERWILDNHLRIQARVFVTCGAAFELFSGMLPLCPRWMADSGLNWLFRLLQNPRRLAGRYLLGNTEFLLRVLAQRARSLLGPQADPQGEKR